MLEGCGANNQTGNGHDDGGLVITFGSTWDGAITTTANQRQSAALFWRESFSPDPS